MSDEKITELLKTQATINKRFKKLIYDSTTTPPIQKQEINQLIMYFEGTLADL